MAQKSRVFTQWVTQTAAGIILSLIGLIPHFALAQSTDEGLRAFETVIEVIKHPRCMNCHTVTDYPRQGDERRRHLFNVVRGPDNHGAPGLQCTACHLETNNDISGVPGAPHWGLPPRSMGWEYMTDGQICQQLIDLDRNGGRNREDVIAHMTGDALVQWAWAPGVHPGGEPRAAPGVTQEEFHAATRTWIEAGAPCPDPAAGRPFDPEEAAQIERYLQEASK